MQGFSSIYAGFVVNTRYDDLEPEVIHQAKKLIREAGVDAKRLEENDRRVAQRPTDMPNNGFLNPR